MELPSGGFADYCCFPSSSWQGPEPWDYKPPTATTEQTDQCSAADCFPFSLVGRDPATTPADPPLVAVIDLAVSSRAVTAIEK